MLSRSAVIFVLLFGFQAVVLAPWVERERGEARLSYEPVAGLEVPADIRLLETALGSFRGWLINFLWLRAGQLEEQGRSHESMQLSRWITRLQPNFPQVWTHQAWNLVFNQSVASSNPEERYLWIESGIELLRDEGIVINRESRTLYQTLAHFYWFKLGDESPDELREFYWRKFAAEWDQNLGAPQGESGAERAEWLRPIEEAPADVEGVLLRYPELEADRELIDVALAGDLREFLAHVSRGERGQDPQATWLADSRLGPARKAFVGFVRAKVLREQYHMDPLLMVELTRELGPIDWRHASAHAIYWAAQGELRIETGEAFPRLVPSLREALFRSHFVTLGLRQLVARGRIGGDPVQGELFHAPEFLCLDAYERAIFEGNFELATEVPARAEIQYWRILEAALESAWLRGNEEVADRCLGRLRRFYGEIHTDPREWLLSRLEDELPTEPEELAFELNQRVGQQFFAMILEGWGDRDAMISERRRDLAERLWTRASLAGTTLEPLDQLERDALKGFLEASPLIASARSKAIVWQRISPEQRSQVSNALHQALLDAATRSGMDPRASFPRP